MALPDGNTFSSLPLPRALFSGTSRTDLALPAWTRAAGPAAGPAYSGDAVPSIPDTGNDALESRRPGGVEHAELVSLSCRSSTSSAGGVCLAIRALPLPAALGRGRATGGGASPPPDGLTALPGESWGRRLDGSAEGPREVGLGGGGGAWDEPCASGSGDSRMPPGDREDAPVSNGKSCECGIANIDNGSRGGGGGESKNGADYDVLPGKFFESKNGADADDDSGAGAPLMERDVLPGKFF